MRALTFKETGADEAPTTTRAAGRRPVDRKVRRHDRLCSLALLYKRLRQCVRSIKKEDRNLLVRGLTNVDCTMHPIRRFVPVGFAGKDLHTIGFSSIPVLDREHVAAHDHGHPMIGVNVPRRSHAWFENQPTDQCSIALADCFGAHGQHTCVGIRLCSLTSGFRRSPLAVRRTASRCSVARRTERQQFDGPQSAGNDHSITRSVRRRTAGGIVMPSALAVLRLMIVSNFAARSKGMSPGLAPLKMRSTK